MVFKHITDIYLGKLINLREIVSRQQIQDILFLLFLRYVYPGMRTSPEINILTPKILI